MTTGKTVKESPDCGFNVGGETANKDDVAQKEETSRTEVIFIGVGGRAPGNRSGKAGNAARL
jgi:hypothetical protein